MLNLLAGFATAQTGSFINAFTGPFYSVIASTMDAALLPAKYKSMARYTTALPGPDALFNTYLHGETDRGQLGRILATHNIPLDFVGNEQWQRTASTWWNAVFNSQIPRMGLEQLIYCYYAGIMDPAQWQDIMKHYRFRNDQEQILKEMMYGKFDQNSIYSLYWRNRWDKPETIKRIRRLFGVGDKHANDLLYSSEFVPPPTDLVRFAVRDVFNRDKTIRDELSKEFEENENIREWFRAQGITAIKVKKADGTEVELDVPLAYWQAHWNLPSPTQAYEMLHRLRPDRLWRYTDEVPEVKAFPIQRLNRLLKSADYAPEWRPELAAISYAVPRLIDVRNMYEKEIIDKDEAKEKLLDRGYNKADAKEVTDYWEINKKEKDKKEKEKEWAKAYARMRNAIINGYKAGSINRSAALNGLLLTDMDVDEVNLLLNAIDIEVNTGKVNQFVTMTKSAFYLGAVDGEQAFALLLQGGLSNQRAIDFIQVWQRQMTLPRKALSAQKIIQYVTDGRLPLNEAKIRLQNLGFTEVDQLLMLDEALDKAQERQAKIDLQNSRSEDAAKRAAERMLEKQQQQAQRAIRNYASIVTLPRMERWYTLGLVDKSWIYNTLIYVGWTQETAQHAIDALPER